MITVNSRNFDGTIRRSWQCNLIEQRGSLLVLVGEFDADVTHRDLGIIKKGTISYEYYWLDRSYNIFRFHEPSGELRNFYCNVSAPPTFGNGVLDYVDLDIDLVVRPDYSYTVLDVEDYVRNAKLFGYTSEVRANVDAALKELIGRCHSQDMPSRPELNTASGSAPNESC